MGAYKVTPSVGVGKQYDPSGLFCKALNKRKLFFLIEYPEAVRGYYRCVKKGAYFNFVIFALNYYGLFDFHISSPFFILNKLISS